MATNRHIIRIESILGGHSPTTHFSTHDQFRASLAINPALPIRDDGGAETISASGLLRPVACEKTGSTNEAPMWFVNTPKNVNIYCYDYAGSVYTISNTLGTVTGLGDLNDGGTATGNGCAYYDNYVYFARSTTVARYGPLNGTPSFTDDYWVGTLGKTALEDTSYPFPYSTYPEFPNHVMHRHSDGRLYIADVVGNTGTIHFIQTTKTTVEGDTDDGSTYDKLHFGYGLWPTAIESYGDSIVIGLIEVSGSTSSNNVGKPNAKIAFWDTTSDKANSITWVEFPDNIISAIKNINGVLYVFSGSNFAPGFRISRYVGANSFEEIYYSEQGNPPYAGAVDGDSNRLMFGATVYSPEYAGTVLSYGLQKSALGQGLFSVFRSTASISNVAITALSLANNGGQGNGFLYREPLVGHTSYSSIGVEVASSFPGNGSVYNNAYPIWWSQMYRIGQKFQIMKIRIPLADYVISTTSIEVKLYVDDAWYMLAPQLTTINFTNFPYARVVTLRSHYNGEPIIGENNFWLELKWTGEDLLTVGLPITIEYELMDD